MKKLGVIGLIIIFMCGQSSCVLAANGSKVVGNGAISPLLGGTGCVEPQDTGALFINPAGVTKIGTRIDVANELAVVDAKLDTSGAANVFFRNTHGLHKSKAQVLNAPHIGFAGRLGETNWYYGLSGACTGGLAVDYKHSRSTPLATGNVFDKHAELYNFEYVGSVGYKMFDKISLGVAGVATFSRFETDMANSALAETVGHDNGSHAWGMGYNVGAIYDVTDFASVGFSYKSPRWNYRFDDYNDILDKINGPPEYIMGVALKPHKDVLIETNVKYIHWRWVDLLEKSPDNGGFGWRNQWVVGVGGQYRLLKKLKLRAGYNYGRSPIPRESVWVNGLSPLITEHHLGLGAGYEITDNWNVDLGWMRGFRKKMEDNGQGDSYSQRGEGTFSIISLDAFFLSFSYDFN